MFRSRLAGYGVIGLGVLCTLSILTLGGSTQRRCPEVGGRVYDAIGVDPTGLRLTGFDLGQLAITWYDGCNWHTVTVLPLLVGGLLLASGVLTIRRGGVES
ncbi:hypothetical protein [Halorientalis pallida]|uniref:Uncharacterized protein n=1 Tax=Halorientalis pallida TaxID=2479928 RepID=A0A498KWT3_9EURY|nr:hypothetical protein [Halorientalis pallida]RXK49305.1 hypothetical protein EAF64_10325 [Halorientalis pallida]